MGDFWGFLLPKYPFRVRGHILGSTFEILGSKSPILGLKTEDLGVFSHPFVAVAFIGFFMGFWGSNGGFLGHPPPHRFV